MYQNLQAAWKDPIVFNNQSYTLEDLANSHFPDKEKDDVEYKKIYYPMYLHHKKSVWNLAIMKCCTYSLEDAWWIYPYNDQNDTHYTYHSATQYGQQIIYPQNPGRYLRGSLGTRWSSYREIYLRSWNLGIGGYQLPKGASDVLFMDDTPGHIINPNGLFNRSYVFEQFALTKPTLLVGKLDDPYTGRGEYHELAFDAKADFYYKDDWDFTGGFFPKLTH